MTDEDHDIIADEIKKFTRLCRTWRYRKWDARETMIRAFDEEAERLDRLWANDLAVGLIVTGITSDGSRRRIEPDDFFAEEPDAQDQAT